MNIIKIPDYSLADVGWRGRHHHHINTKHKFVARKILSWDNYFTVSGALYGELGGALGFDGFFKIQESECKLIFIKKGDECDYYNKITSKIWSFSPIESFIAITAEWAIELAKKRINLKFNINGIIDPFVMFSLKFAHKILEEISEPKGFAVLDIDNRQIIWLVPPIISSRSWRPNGCFSKDGLTCCFADENQVLIIDNPFL